MQIIEQISRNGVRSTDVSTCKRRFENPRPGDMVDFGDNEGTYPFVSGSRGRIETVGTEEQPSFLGPGRTHICCEQGSVFLNYDGSVSISGGPFVCVETTDLEPTYSYELVRFWNWGDNTPGADQGCEYHIARPVFRLKKQGK